ncbi:MAG: hypothetical protein ACRDFT_03315 [bacterium]
MTRKVVFCLALVGLLGLSGQAHALIGTIDDVPAATLLLPFFEVDNGDPNGVTTLFSINNASATAILTHVTVWSDQSVPVVDFDVYLTRFDVVTINLRDILVNGNLPRTASAGQDTVGDTISPQGPISQDINFASCSGILPYTNPAISASFRAHLQAWLIGNTSPVTGNCAGANFDGSRSAKTNNIMRGYVTVDTVNACNLLFPAQLATGYDAFLTDQNVIWGDYFYVNPGQNFAQGETLVHIEACRPPGSGVGDNPPGNLAECPFVPGDHTFYGRYASATAIDQREPLATTFAVRYINGGAFNGGTDFLVWREGDSAAAGYSCAQAGPPSWYPLPATQIVLFDEEENPVQQEDCPSGDPTCEQEIVIPNEAQRVDVAGDLLAPFDFGWAFLNLQHTEIIAAYGDDDAQAWVTAVMDAEGRFSVGFDAIQLDNANNPNTIILPVQ